MYLRLRLRVKWLRYGMSYKKIKISAIPDAFRFQTFTSFILFVFEVTHLWRPQKMTNKWSPLPLSHHLQKWINLLFFNENLLKLSSVELSKKPSLYFPLYQLFFEKRFGEFMSVTIIMYVAIRNKIWFLKCHYGNG